MDFTREPIIETVITPKEGCKIVVRSSKNAGQEEFFVDALEVVSFGGAIFFRSQEKPKAFLVPVSDYEVLEVREARMVLKNVGLDRSIKIGGGREQKAPKEQVQEKVEVAPESETASTATEEAAPANNDSKSEKKRDRRRQQRRRRGREEGARDESAAGENAESNQDSSQAENGSKEGETKSGESVQANPAPFSTLLPPPPTLISETIGRYKENALFKNAFYTKEEVDAEETAAVVEHMGDKLDLATEAASETLAEVLSENQTPVTHVETIESPAKDIVDAHTPFIVESEPLPIEESHVWNDAPAALESIDAVEASEEKPPVFEPNSTEENKE